MSEDVIMGSDGVCRRLFDWVLFIRYRAPYDEMQPRDSTGHTFYAYAELAWMYKSKNFDLLTKLECTYEGDAEYKYKEAKEYIGEVAKEHFMRILEESISENMSAPSERGIDDVMESFTDEIKKLARRTSPKFRNKEVAFYKVAKCLEDYILKHDTLPASPQELEDFSIEEGDRLPRRTIAAHLPRFYLEEKIRGNEKMP